AREAAGQGRPGEPGARRVERLFHAVHHVRGEDLVDPEPRLPCRADGGEEVRVARERGDEMAAHPCSSIGLSAATPLIPHIEMIGRVRTKSRKQVKKRPNEPIRMATSMTVGRYIPQLDGRKSRCSEVTMITKRSNHMPTLTSRETAKSTGTEVRSRFDHRSWGTKRLQVIIVQ